jgi:hypothetical protein
MVQSTCFGMRPEKGSPIRADQSRSSGRAVAKRPPRQLAELKPRGTLRETRNAEHQRSNVPQNARSTPLLPGGRLDRTSANSLSTGVRLGLEHDL